MSDETPGAGQSAVPREGLAPKPAAVRNSMASGQYVVTSQSSNPAYLQQIRVTGSQQGIQRIINVSPSKNNQASTLPPSLTNQSIVKALTKTRFQNVAESGSPAATRTATKRYLPTPPEKKDTYAAKLQRVLNHRNVRSKIVREKYSEHLLEMYHLEMGGNLLDLYQIAKRPKTAQFLQYMKENSIDPKDVEETSTPPIPTATAASSLPGMSTNTSTNTATTSSTMNNTPAPSPVPSVSRQSVDTKPPALKSTKVSTTPTTPSNPEQIVEKAKHEAYIVQRISDLQKEGLWPEKRLPKVQEMPRAKAHWDYLLEEMVWLAADFAQERKWKKAAAKKCARMVQKYFQDKAQAAQKAEKAHEQHMRRVAAFVAKEIKNFWGNVEKLVEYKQNTRLEEKRKQAMDQHLSFIVDQTEKYSQLLAEGMNKPHAEQNSNSNPASNANSDDEFRPDVEDDEDDEETIAQEEAQDEGEKSEEIAALQRESQMDFDDFLSELPKDYLIHRDKIRLSDSSDSDESEEVKSTATASTTSKVKKVKDDANDEDFTMDSSEEDDENTIQEQEQAEGEQDHQAEIDDLNEEAEMDIEELRRKYANMKTPPPDESSNMTPTTDGEAGASDDDVSGNSSSEDEADVDDKSALSEQEVGTEIGLKSLLDDSKEGDEIKTDNNDLINDAAAIAESLQPKGNTLSSTSVVTPVPFLLKFPLREYQHIGLDWLVTMFDRKLNGILADEMGLGKTIQTIAVLAHLACEKSNWGPHLIVVPTSVMLNWEMECKKWCPGFKILTYYGTQKERKLKRTGWTKPNAFHICITSYKLVIQDHQSFRRKKWKYLILDEAQNIKNFKSQRWQLLLNFQTQQRLLLTGTPLQNNLMELWSLMHFLMPNVFQSHREFKEWFSNPVTGMIEGNSEYNENIIKRLHKVLRPFLLRRLKCEVEKQMPKKFEHVVMCRLSKRQRFLYDDYMSRTKTKETLATGNLLSVINVLMQLRKVCNHPNLFEARPTISPFHCDGIVQHVPALVYSALDYDVWKNVDLRTLGLNLLHLEFHFGAYHCYRLRQLKTTRKLIEVISTKPKPATCPPSRLCLKVHRNPVNRPTAVKDEGKTALGQKVKLIQHQGIKAVQIAPGATTQTSGSFLSNVLTPSVPSYAQLVETLTGKHILFTPTCNINTNSIGITGTTTVMTSSGQKLTLLPKQSMASTTPNNQSSAIAKAVVKVHFTSLPNSNSGSPIAKDNINVDVTSTPRKPIDTNFLEQLYRQAPNSNKNTDVRCPSTFSQGEDEKEYSEDVEAWHTYKLEQLARFNEYRCGGEPIYGQDLMESVLRFGEVSASNTSWTSGKRACYEVQHGLNERQTPNMLKDIIHTPVKLIQKLNDIFDRFIVYVPSAHAPEPELQVWNPSPSTYWGRLQERKTFALQLSEPTKPLHHIASSMMTQFPHPRLIQYDCGKLQTLDRLLRRLKSDSHRVLIFTQMTKMLDVLEAFLNFHGHIYLRLDGSTRIDQRQILMERFNGDPKIFAFILSTRSGGVGVNLTGADTVIFYDSDWNPTMDAQAQDRCHRIGQTRDVHIYRLVSEMTIEENILKKANQKRLLGDLAIEGGNFTTAYFKSSTIQDLFSIDQNEESAATRMSEVVECSREREKHTEEATGAASDEKSAMGALENALAAAEDDQDVMAACTAKAEAVAELAEFDENIPLEDKDDKEKEPEISKAEQEVVNLIKQLTPIERYAMRFIEETESAWSVEQLAAAEREIEEKKREWEENRLATMREEEERRARELEEESELLTFSREDATNQIWVSSNSNEQMPMWCPPTPPQQDTDIYVDHTMNFLYDTNSVMLETQLPPVYIKKEPKRTRVEAGLVDSRRPAKVHKRDDVTQPPKSIFNNNSLAVKIRRDARFQKYRGLMRPQMPPIPGVKYPMGKPPVEAAGHNWTIHEDAAILKVIQSYQGLNLNLVLSYAGHTPNWDFVADYVNTVSNTYRSAKQCRNRYESVLVPREEGKQTLDTSPRKKKQKTMSPGGTVYKFQVQPKSNRPTSQLYVQDNNTTFNNLMTQRFDSLKAITAKKPVSTTQQQIGGTIPVKNPKHESILLENGIDIESPMSAIEIAAKRAERNREKKAALPDQIALQKLQLIRQAQAASAAAAQASNSSNSATTSSQQAIQQQQQQPLVQTVAPIVHVTTVQTVVTAVVTTTPSTPPTNVARMQRIVAASPLQGQSVVSVSGISAGQLQGQRLIVSGTGQSKATLVGAGSMNAKALREAQLQMIRQATIKQQAQHMRLQTVGLSAQGLKTTSVVTLPGHTVQLAQSQPRTHIVKGGTVAVGGNKVARTLSESEVAHFLKLKSQSQKLAGQATTVANQQVFAQALQAGPSGTQVATIVKTVSTSGVTQAVIGTPVKTLPTGIKTQATPQHIRSLQIQHLMQQKKLQLQHANSKIGVAQVTSKGGVATQLLVGAKPLTPAITMQQLQQVIRSPLTVPQSVVLAKGPSRMIPINAGQGTKPTIQVVTSPSPGLTTTIRPPTSSTLTAAALAGIKVQNAAGTSHAQQQAILSQVSAMLGQNARQGSPVRIQTAGGTPVAVTVQQQSSSPNVQQQMGDKPTDNYYTKQASQP